MFPNKINQHAILAFSVAFLSAIAFFTLYPGDDPYRCRALIRTGRWIDPPSETGNRWPFAHWQPDGCIIKKYEVNDIRSCVQKRSLVFGGDSTSRFPLWQTARMLTTKRRVRYDASQADNNHSFNLSYHGIDIFRDANEWLHTDFDTNATLFMDHLRRYKAEKAVGFELPIEDQKGPAIFYLSAGVWYTNPSNHSGINMPDLDMHGRSKLYSRALLNVSKALGPNNGKTFYNEPLDPIDGVGNQLFLFPPHGPNPLIKARKDRIPQTEEMRAWLAAHEHKINMPVVWANSRMVEGQNQAWNGDYTGFHVRKALNVARMNLVFNARCNAKLDRMRPHDYGTCCTDYGFKPTIQRLAVSLLIFWLVLCIGFSAIGIIFSWDEPKSVLFSTQVAAFPLVLLMCYFADRTQMMPKGERIYIASTFSTLVFLIVVMALATIRKSRREEGQYQPINNQFPQEEPDDFFSGPLTEEWTGWMQLILLAYHWCNAAPEQPAFITTRMFVAAYLFHSGYVNTRAYLDKGDFSFYCVVSTLLRLNLLAWSLTFVMNVDYMAYYISPLLSFWYLIVYFIMAIAQRFNDSPSTLIPKIAVSGVLVSSLLSFTPLIEWSHWAGVLLFHIQYSKEAWNDCLTQDMFIVYIGMAVATLSKHYTPRTLVSSITTFLAASSIVACFCYGVAASRFDASAILELPSVPPFLPILGYVALRNVSGTARRCHSTAMACIGRCSLETWILQVHLLMASTAQGVLLVDGLSGGDANILGRLASLMIIVPIFLWASSAVSDATEVLTTVFLGCRKLDTSFEQRSVGVPVAIMPWVMVGALLAVMWTTNLLSPVGMKSSTY